TLLIFTSNKKKEGTLLNPSLQNMQDLMTNQDKLLAAMKKRYPQFLQTAQGRQALQQHINTLERFEKVLERFQNQGGPNAEKVSKTLQAVRASILLFEKTEESIPHQDKTSTGAFAAVGNSGAGGTSSVSIWGWILLLSGAILGIGAIGYLIYDRKRTF
ncbi:MAG: hypothetical protein AAGJ35_16400, partial [Myxococcota bacterium]